MDNKEEEFLKRLQAMFKIEADEHISSLSSGLLELEKHPDSHTSKGLIETIFREAHSLKGAARSVERGDIESICQEMESLLSRIKNKEQSLSSDNFDLLHLTLDHISKLILSENSFSRSENKALAKKIKLIAQPQPSEPIEIYEEIRNKPEKNIEQPREQKEKTTEQPEEQKEIISVTTQDTTPKQPEVVHEKKVTAKEKDSPSETIRIQTAKLDPLFLQAEQLIQSSISSAQQVDELVGLQNFVDAWKIDYDKKTSSGNQSKEYDSKQTIEFTKNKLREIEEIIDHMIKRSDNDQRVLDRLINEHLDTVKDLLMLPISTIVEGFPLLVRDLARSQNKDIELIITGSSVEVDKRILEELKDPLIHIIRNCIDHGIKKQKSDIGHSESEKGKIVMKFSSLDGRNLGISISDNGSGIDVKKVLTAAIKEGIVSKEKGNTIDSAEIKKLIFKSGLSTSAMITDISGRGLGLAIVKEKVEKLEGTVTVESEPGKGTIFHIILPLTLSTFRGVMVACTKQLFFIPTNYVVRVIRENYKNIKTVENRDTIVLDDMVIPIVRLRDILRLKNNDNNNELLIFDEKNPFLQILVLENNGQQIGFIVEEILDEHQILVKDLGKQLVKVRNISGAAILGSGKVVPVINIKELMSSAVESGRRSVSARPKAQKEKVYKILVTEDSITSRTLIKEILENAGYVVETAVDGLDGYLKAKEGEFDLIVSDVDMPKMNGFELTTKIRNDSNLSEIPVVLVTALGSKEDKEHGIDVGASAYIVKSSFEKSNLLDVVKKLL